MISDTSSIRQNRSTKGLAAFETCTFGWDTASAVGKVSACNKELGKEKLWTGMLSQ